MKAEIRNLITYEFEEQRARVNNSWNTELTTAKARNHMLGYIKAFQEAELITVGEASELLAEMEELI